MWVPYFYDDQAWDLCRKEMLSWEGTPYRHLTMVKGRGADCTLFVGAVWKSLGILEYVTHDYYPRDWHIHTSLELVKNGFEWHFRNALRKGYSMIDVDNRTDFIRGDVLCFATTSTGVTNHTAIWCGYWPETKEKDQMFNSIDSSRRGVCRIKYGSWWRARLTSILRVMREI